MSVELQVGRKKLIQTITIPNPVPHETLDVVLI